MSFLAQARRYWHTVSHLRPSQALARADLRLRATARRRWPRQAAERYARRARAAGLVWTPDRWGLQDHAGEAAALVTGPERARLAADAADRQRGRFTFLHETAGGDGAIDWRAPAASQLWRYHLHYFDFLPEAIVAGESWPALAPILHGWIAANPLGASVARDAWHSYVVSLRTTNWLWAAAADPGPREDPVVRASLETQVLFLERNLETDVGGNHLLKNLKALTMAGAFFDGPHAAALRRFGPAFTRELARQLRSDGGHYEQSPMYHAQVLVDAIEVACAIALARQAQPDGLGEAIDRMRRFLGRVCHPDGQIAQFGDSAFNMTPPPREVLAAAGAALGEALEPPVAPRHAVAVAALGARAAPRTPPRTALPTAPPAALPTALPTARSDAGQLDALVVDLASSGCYVLATARGRCRLIADAGPTCPDDLPAHAHADLFGFELSIDGERLIVDAGVSEYRAGPWRAYERSTRAHNTVEVDGVEQSDCWGSFRVAERAHVVAAAAVEAPGVRGFVARHDGYERLASPVRHTRQIVLVAERAWLIVDVLDGPGAHRWETFLHVHPDAAITDAGPLAWRVTRGAAALSVVAVGVADPRLVRGALEPRQGWYAPEFGCRLAAPALTLSGSGPLPATFGWLLGLETAPPARVRTGPVGTWTVEVDGREIAVPIRVP